MVARERRWSEARAVGDLSFVNTAKRELGFKAENRELTSRLKDDSVGIENLKSKIQNWLGEAYRSNFAGENEALTLGFGTKILKLRRFSLVRPQTQPEYIFQSWLEQPAFSDSWYHLTIRFRVGDYPVAYHP
jgi:hypothetical protein